MVFAGDCSPTSRRLAGNWKVRSDCLCVQDVAQDGFLGSSISVIHVKKGSYYRSIHVVFSNPTEERNAGLGESVCRRPGSLGHSAANSQAPTHTSTFERVGRFLMLVFRYVQVLWPGIFASAKFTIFSQGMIRRRFFKAF